MKELDQEQRHICLEVPIRTWPQKIVSCHNRLTIVKSDVRENSWDEVDGLKRFVTDAAPEEAAAMRSRCRAELNVSDLRDRCSDENRDDGK